MTWARAFTALLLIAGLIVNRCPQAGAEIVQETKVVLLYHSGDINAGLNLPALYNMVSHFSRAIATVNVEQKTPAAEKATLDSAAYIIYLGDADKKAYLSTLWQRSLQNTAATLYFLGADPTRTFANLPFSIQGEVTSVTTLVAKGHSYPLAAFQEMENVQVKPSGNDVRVTAEVDNGDQRTPFLLSVSHGEAGKRLFYSTLYTPFAELSYIIADSLFDFFQVEAKELHQVYVRIEDIHPDRDPLAIRKIVDYLKREKVPFLLGVIPIYKGEGREFSLTDRPELVKALKYAMANGGTLIMHGDTHQYYASETGEGYEFWDSRSKAPIPNENTYVDGKLRQGLSILLKNGLYPAAFEPPHYAMTSKGYEITRRYFTTIVGNVQLSDTQNITQETPLPILQSYHGHLKFYTENGGYVSDETPQIVPDMLANVRKANLVRQSVTGVFFHPFLPLSYLQELVKGLKQMRLPFFDLKQQDNEVTTPWGTVRTADGALQISAMHGLDQAAPPKQESKVQEVSTFVSWGIVAIVGTVILVFVIQVRILRRRRALRLFPEVRRNGEGDKRT